MKKLFLLLILLSSCKTKDFEYYKPVVSTEKVKLASALFEEDKDSISLLIPLEYKLDLNKSDVLSAKIYYYVDKEYLNLPNKMMIYNKKNNKKEYLGIKRDEKYPNAVYLIQSNFFISKDEANVWLQKYNPKFSAYDIKFGDTIELVSYKKFREENTAFIKDLRKIPDSIYFRIAYRDSVKVFKEEVKW